MSERVGLIEAFGLRPFGKAAREVFQEKELVDLTIAIGLMNAYNRLAIGFRNTPQAVLESPAAT